MAFKTVHTPRESYLSEPGVTYGGLYNLLLVLLALFAFRMALENGAEYGLLVHVGLGVNPLTLRVIFLLMAKNVFIVTALIIEKMAAKNLIPARVARLLTVSNQMGVVLFPVIIIGVWQINPVGSFICLGLYTIGFLKLVSYGAVCSSRRKAARDCLLAGAEHPQPASQPKPRLRRSSRLMKKYPQPHPHIPAPLMRPVAAQAQATGEDGALTYPDNLTLIDLYHFMLMPTLCYQLNFPRTKSIRKGFLATKIVELILLVQMSLCIQQQFVTPFIKEAAIPLLNFEILEFLPAFLKLAISNNICWLLFFLAYFHVGLNIFGEITYFADRQFYTDWWNSETVGQFWQKWNKPVHNWCLRHLYIPLRAQGVSKWQAQLVVFVFSAIFHEYLVSVPLQMYRLWSFWGIVAQLPLTIMTQPLAGRLGNAIMWISIIIGQPFGLVSYYVDAVKLPQ